MKGAYYDLGQCCFGDHNSHFMLTRDQNLNDSVKDSIGYRSLYVKYLDKYIVFMLIYICCRDATLSRDSVTNPIKPSFSCLSGLEEAQR